MKCLQARINHRHFQEMEEYINASESNKAYLLPMTLRDKLKYELAEYIEQNMITKTIANTIYQGNPFNSDGAWAPGELTTTSVKLYLLTEEEYNNIKEQHEHINRNSCSNSI